MLASVNQFFKKIKKLAIPIEPAVVVVSARSGHPSSSLDLGMAMGEPTELDPR